MFKEIAKAYIVPAFLIFSVINIFKSYFMLRSASFLVVCKLILCFCFLFIIFII